MKYYLYVKSNYAAHQEERKLLGEFNSVDEVVERIRQYFVEYQNSAGTRIFEVESV